MDIEDKQDNEKEEAIDDLDLDTGEDILEKEEKKEEDLLTVLGQDNNEKKGEEKEDSVVISKSKIVLANKLLKNIKENNEKLIQLLSGYATEEEERKISISQIGEGEKEETGQEEAEGKIIEGVFDGENMIGPDGKQYNVPANYASKSRLVEGDILKLTITSRGTFVYKQIGPIERTRVVGQLIQENDGNFFVASEGKKWRVLTASATYYKGRTGDEAVILIPKNGDSKWAAVENIVNKSE